MIALQRIIHVADVIDIMTINRKHNYLGPIFRGPLTTRRIVD